MRPPSAAPAAPSGQGTRLAFFFTLIGFVSVFVPSTVRAQLLVVDASGRPIEGAVVFADEREVTPENLVPDSASSQSIDQRDKRFVPLVTVATPGSLIEFPNSDDIRHHVYSFSDGNAFERKLYRSNDAEPVKFAAAGVAALGCNIHDNMQAYVLITDRSVIGVSNEEGIVGKWTDSGQVHIELWHPSLNAEGSSGTFAINRTTIAPTVELPIAWSDPQQVRSSSDLESLLKRFSSDPT